MGIAACYSMDLYCDNNGNGAGSKVWPDASSGDGIHAFNEFPHQYQGETFGECARAARADGWIFKRDGMTVLCPKCRKVKLPSPVSALR